MNALRTAQPAGAMPSKRPPPPTRHRWRASPGPHRPLWLAAIALVEAALSLAQGNAGGQAPGSLTPPAWRAPAAAEVEAQLQAWLDQRKADATTRAKALELWKSPPQDPPELLDRLVRTFALADENVRQLVEFCSKPRGFAVPPVPPWLTSDGSTPRFVARNVRLWYARWLVHEALFDEAAEMLRGLAPGDVVDPASLWFCQAVVYHRLVQAEAARQALRALLSGTAAPQRYLALARLMDADLKGLKEDTLDHIARRMADIERRLDLGRAGPKVRKLEDGVIESLDKLIQRLEAQQQQANSANGANNLQSMRPAQDSRIMEGKGRGDVERKRVGSQGGWGNLPPRQREEALQQIGRDFPPHYREIVEQYFRKLASEGSQ